MTEKMTLSLRSQRLLPFALLGGGLLVGGMALSYPVGLVLISAGIFD